VSVGNFRESRSRIGGRCALVGSFAVSADLQSSVVVGHRNYLSLLDRVVGRMIGNRDQ
jgi:hypothetical protein